MKPEKKTVSNVILRIHKIKKLCYNWKKAAGRRTMCPEKVLQKCDENPESGRENVK